MIPSSDITVVFQGNLENSSQLEVELFVSFVLNTKKTLPDATIIFSTWHGVVLPKKAPIDLVVRSIDPGSLPSFKFDEKPNNINRQIVTTQVGLNAVKTKYAVKIRADAYLEHADFLSYYERFNLQENVQRIVSASFFTLDPHLFEHIPFHISDWFQFGETTVLQSYWDVNLMSYAEASYYENHPHKKKSSYLDKKFKVKFAIEQYIAINYAKKHSYITPKFHNDDTTQVLEAHNSYLATHFIILDPWQIGLRLPKYASIYDSKFQWLKCVMFVDWYYLYIKNYSPTEYDAKHIEIAIERMQEKNKARYLEKITNHFGWLIYSKKVRKTSFKLLNFFQKL